MQRKHRPLVELRGVWKSYSGEAVLRGVSLDLEPGKTTLIRGKTGVGKTTLAEITALNLAPDRGEIRILGKSLQQVRKSPALIGYVPQDLRLAPTLTVLENTALPLVYLGYKPKQAAEIAEKLLEELDVPYKDRYPGQLSGGQRQRAAIARALAASPKIIVADEPLSHQDDENAQKILELLTGYVEKNSATLLILTTDLYTWIPCHKEYVLERGRLLPA